MGAQEDNSGVKLTRRVAIRWVAASIAGVVTATTSLRNRKKAFAQLTKKAKVSDEPVVRVVTEPTRVMFTVEGPIPVGRGIELAGAESAFVAPNKLRLIEHTTHARLYVHFMFLGEEDPDRLIKLTVVLKDSSGNILRSLTRLCEDRRIEARKEKFLSAWVFRSTPTNTGAFRFDKDLVDRVGRIDVTFEEL